MYHDPQYYQGRASSSDSDKPGFTRKEILSCGDYKFIIYFIPYDHTTPSKTTSYINNILNELNEILKEDMKESGEDEEWNDLKFEMEDLPSEFYLQDCLGNEIPLEKGDALGELYDLFLGNKELAVNILCGELFGFDNNPYKGVALFPTNPKGK